MHVCRTDTVFGDGEFAAIGADGVLTSPNGQAWTTVVSSDAIQGGDLVWTGTQYVAVGSAGTILTSAGAAAESSPLLTNDGSASGVNAGSPKAQIIMY